MSVIRTLYRPVSHQQLQQMENQSTPGFSAALWPASEYFYAIADLEYAFLLAKGWAEREQGAIYLTGFQVPDSYLANFRLSCMGANHHQEYWVPLSALAEFSQQIVGPIDVLSVFSQSSHKLYPMASRVSVRQQPVQSQGRIMPAKKPFQSASLSLQTSDFVSTL